MLAQARGTAGSGRSPVPCRSPRFRSSKKTMATLGRTPRGVAVSMCARTSGLVQQPVVDLLAALELLVRLVGRGEHPRMGAVPRVVVGDVGEVAHPAVQAEQVERGRAEEEDRHVVGAEEVPHLGDVLQPAPRLPGAEAKAASVPTLTSAAWPGPSWCAWPVRASRRRTWWDASRRRTWWDASRRRTWWDASRVRQGCPSWRWLSSFVLIEPGGHSWRTPRCSSDSPH